MEDLIQHTTIYRFIGDAKFAFTTEWIENSKTDTKVSLNGDIICFISPDKINEFSKKLEDLINDYRI